MPFPKHICYFVDSNKNLVYSINNIASPSLSNSGVNQMTKKKIKMNRAPVLTLWATIVAERLGYKKDEALTFGKAVAGLNAQSKGRRLGIYEEEKDDDKEQETKEEKKVKVEFIELLGRGVPAVKTP